MQKIIYGIHQTDLGSIILGLKDQGTKDRPLCWLGFMVSLQEGAYKGDGLERMKAYFPNAAYFQDDRQTKQMMQSVLTAWRHDTHEDLDLDIEGSDFQRAVWKVLMHIPKGQTKSYGEIASLINKPKAYRAVGTAVGQNPISLIIPCHRVIQKDGSLGNYGWGLEIKKKILDLEVKIAA